MIEKRFTDNLAAKKFTTDKVDEPKSKTDEQLKEEEYQDRLRIHRLQAETVHKVEVDKSVKHTYKPAETEKQRILREAGGLPSNIGIESPYWQLPD